VKKKLIYWASVTCWTNAICLSEETEDKTVLVAWGP